LRLLHNKHIPAMYLRASVRQRSELLAGLLDSDGSCSLRSSCGPVPSGQVTFSNSDRGLIDGFAELAASLGFVPTVCQARAEGVESHRSSVAYGRRLRKAWRVAFTPDRQVFGIGRKQRVLEPALSAPRRSTTRKRYVVSIDRVEPVPVRCITVDSSEHLYLVGRTFIPTHNCRENFGQRISLGPLSPDGAQMMWNNPVTGVTLPRGRIGRAIGLSTAGVPVEMQCYRVPDPKDAIVGTKEHELLMQLRPTESRQERLVIVPPQTGWSGEGPEEPTFTDYARAEWVRAVDRPDLDPLARPGDRGGVDGRALSSPMALFGLTGTRTRSARRPVQPEGVAVPTSAAGGMSSSCSGVEELPGDGFDGYGPVLPVRPGGLRVGDLIRVDDDLDAWAVVEEEPLPDFDDEEYLVVAWCDD
jgi:hypothetical protein